jgi:hypothetical protein
MKKTISLFLIYAFTINTALFAQQTDPSGGANPTPTAPATEITPSINPSQYQATGTAAAKSSQKGRSTSWQNWVFAGAALVLAAAGIIAVTVNGGENSPNH